MNNVERNTETLSYTMAEEVPDLLQNVGGSHPACCRDDAVREDHGNATALGTDTESQSVNDKVGVTTSHQTPPVVEREEEKTLYHSVLAKEMQQQLPTKLFVIAKERDSEIIETSEVKYSNGPLSEHEALNQKEETFTSSVTSQNNTVAQVGKSDCDRVTVFSANSADTTFSGQTAAQRVTLKAKRRTPSTSKKQAKEDCHASTNLLNVPDLNREVSVHPRLITAPEVQRKSRKMSSVTFKEDTKITRDNGEIARNSPAMISSVDVSKTRTSKWRKKSSTFSVKKRTKQIHLPQTSTDHNAMMPQDVSEGFLVSDVTQKDENEALCTTAAKIHSKEKKAGRTFSKKALMSKAKQIVQDAEITVDSKKSDTYKVDVLSYQQTSLSQVSSRGKKRKREVISRASERRSTEKQRSKLKSAPNDEPSFQVVHRDCGVHNVEVKIRHPKTLKKVRIKRIRTSRSKCKKGQQAVQLLSTEDISLQKQNETALDKETTDILTSQLQNPRKHTVNNKKCKAEPVNVPVSEPAMNQCAAAKFLMQMSDIKTKKRDSKKSRRRKRPVQRAKNTITLNAPVKEESDYFDIQGDTFSQEQQLNEETTRGNNPEKPRKGQRKRKKVEDKASEQTMNPDLNIKHEGLVLNQLDFPPMHIKEESDERHISPIKTQNGNMLVAVLNVQDNLTNPPNENPHDVKITGNQEETLNVLKEEQLISDRIEAANPENLKKFKGKKKRLVGRRRPKVAALVKGSGKVAGEVQGVENGLTYPSLPENVPENIKAKRKREGKRAKQTLTSDHSGEGFNIVSNPDNTSLNKNVQEKVRVKRKRNKAVEDNKDVKLEPEDNISASFVGQTKESPEMAETVSSEKSVITSAKKSTRGNQRASRKRKMKSTKRKFGQTAKKKALMRLPNLKSSEQQPESDTGVLVNQEICNKPKTRCKSGKGKAPARSGKASKAIKMEDTVTSIHHTADKYLNAVKQEHDESKISELASEAASPFHDKISPAESAVSVGNTKMTKIRKRRRNKTVWYPKKKLKRHQIGASFDSSMSPFSFHPCNSLTDDEMIDLKLKDENDDVTQRNTVQSLSSDQAEEMTANTEVNRLSELKNYDHLQQKLKPQKPLKCSFCGRSFRHISAFTVHKRIHTGEKPYRCTTCGKRFAHISRLNLHSKIHTESPAVCCPCCDRKFKSKDELIVHFCIHVKDIKSLNVTEDERNQQVDDCLDSPVTSSHNKPFRCSICCKEFISRATFKMHKRTNGGKPHTCSVCGKKFCKPSSLNVHEKTHCSVKPYSCSVCNTGFVKLQELKRHSETHSGVTPFSCTRCGKPFGSFALLRSHQASEVCSKKRDSAEGNRVDIEGFLVSQGVEGQIVTPVYFKCPICKQLHHHWCQHVLHLQTHNKSKSYTCETCGQEYECASDMRSHCSVCCRASGEERACRSSLSEIWKEPEAPQSERSEPPHEDQKGQTSFSPQVETGEERACRSSLSEIWKKPEAPQSQRSEPPHEDQKGQTSLSPQVETGEKEVTDMQSPPSPSDSNPSVDDNFDIRIPSPNPGGEFSGAGNDQTTRQPSRFRPQSLIRRHCGRYSCGHCGKSLNRWSKLWLHRRSHRQTVRPFCCSQCDLEFRFLGSYIDHLQEHAAQTPYACPLCPDTFSSDENLSAHIFECHKQDDGMKCSTCGRSFSTLRHLKKHKLLHKGAISHFCLLCNVSFSRISALKTHLKTHGTRLNVPQPAGLVEPFLFPYHCRKCTAKFSSTDLLQAHQVCHFAAGEKPDDPPESIASRIPSRTPEDTRQGDVSESSQRKRRLPVSNKKHLFRYPHPDRLYVVPVVSSEPPVVISDTEEDPFITASVTMSSAFPQGQPAPNISNIHQSSAVLILGDMDEHETGSSHQQLQDQYQDALKDISVISGCDSDSAELEPVFMILKENEFVDDAHNCAICMETFTNISKLHEHYIDHAKRM